MDGHDLVVGMNRDESPLRPADPPALLEGQPTLVVAGRDRKAGGTWLGASGSGLVIGLSNLRGSSSATARSRGLLVLDALKQPSLPALDLLLQRETAEHEYNPFHLLAMDRRGLRFFRYDGQLSMNRGRDGLNVLTNEGGNADADPKARTVEMLLAKAPHRTVQDALRTLQSVLRHHGDAGTVSLCVHGMGAETVSSTILALNNADPGENVLLQSAAAPCQEPYRDYHEVVRRLTGPD